MKFGTCAGMTAQVPEVRLKQLMYMFPYLIKAGVAAGAFFIAWHFGGIIKIFFITDYKKVNKVA